MLHRPEVLALFADVPSAPPQASFDTSNAEHNAVAPPPDPAQLHVHGPEPATADAAPALHSFVIGARVNPAPPALPQAPPTERCPGGAECCG